MQSLAKFSLLILRHCAVNRLGNKLIMGKIVRSPIFVHLLARKFLLRLHLAFGWVQLLRLGEVPMELDRFLTGMRGAVVVV